MARCEADRDGVGGLNDTGPRGVGLRRELYAFLVRVAGAEARLRRSALQLAGPDLDDLAHQAAADALVAILGRLDSFRGESRFTTWAYRFVAFDLADKVEGHVRQRVTVALSDQQWAAMPAQHSEPEYEMEALYPSAW